MSPNSPYEMVGTYEVDFHGAEKFLLRQFERVLLPTIE